MDRPRSDGWAHLFSDLPGDEGTIELLTFAERSGLRRFRLHAHRTYAEHLDIRDGEIPLVRAAGARSVDRRELGDVLRKKKAVMGPRRARSRR